ncbi:hypothetical protein [Flavipsychrobacter stenotrophus]|nr:hypothetical protein [Flavipsychrobacter stenotrophus]
MKSILNICIICMLIVLSFTAMGYKPIMGGNMDRTTRKKKKKAEMVIVTVIDTVTGEIISTKEITDSEYRARYKSEWVDPK